jgi:tetratricopeptide (TPR) repeat protein
VLTGERVAFTGTLASMTHRAAAELVEAHGGQAVQHVSQQTTLLVIGDEGWPLEPDGQPSVKLLQAQALQQRGHPLRLLSEAEWRAILGLEPRATPQTLYTPAMLSQLLGVSVHAIRRWERWNLIHPIRRVMRLPYFDLAEVSAARRLAELIANGVSVESLAASLDKLQAVLPGVPRPLVQLPTQAIERQLLYRDQIGWVEPRSGQRRLPFVEDAVESPPETSSVEPVTLPFRAVPPTAPVGNWTADDWFQQGCRLVEEGRAADAVEAYRSALIEAPAMAEYHFHLADALYQVSKIDGAIERYYAAVEHDHDFIEAWTQLGCVLAEHGATTAAEEALRIALERHPDYPDAHFHLAQLLTRRESVDEARPHWAAYLRHDAHGPWAEIARQHLENESP